MSVHLICVIQVYLVRQSGVFHVLLIMGRDDDQIAAFIPGLPECFAGLNTELLCLIILCQDNSVTVLWVSAHGNRVTTQGLVQHTLSRSIKVVHVAM